MHVFLHEEDTLRQLSLVGHGGRKTFEGDAAQSECFLFMTNAAGKHIHFICIANIWLQTWHSLRLTDSLP